MTEWEIHGMEFTNCNCDYGCPCQFNARPTHGDCRAVVFVRIDRGRFGTVPLDGLAFASAVTWPGAIPRGTAPCSRSSTGAPTRRNARLCAAS